MDEQSGERLPELDRTAQQRAHRHPGRQPKRWDDDLVTFLRQQLPHLHPTPTQTQRRTGDINDTSWLATARDVPEWAGPESAFAQMAKDNNAIDFDTGATNDTTAPTPRLHGNLALFSNAS